VKLSSYENLRVPNFSLHALCGVLDDAELDWRTALANADIAPDAVNRPGGTIPAKKELAFQLQFVALTRDRVDLWMRAARAYTLGSFGVRGLALVTAPTLAAWVETATAMDYAPGLIESAPLRTPDGTVAGIEFTYPGVPEELIPFSVYRELCVTTRTLPWIYGGPFPFTRIEFPLAEISPEVSTHVPCSIECGPARPPGSERLRIWWDPAASAHELPFGDAFQHAAWVKEDNQILDSLRTTGDWPHTVAMAIRAAPELNRKLANVATTLRVSPRTLQRKLELTGHDFAQLRDETLRNLASDLLSNTDHSISRISRTLGYTDPASFTIAFKRWKGVPPTAFREASHYRNNVNAGI
jgi:AraC-like DNA-binding protein